MTIDDQIRDKNYIMILIKKLQKHEPYHLAKLISMNILQVNKYCLLIKKKKKKKKNKSTTLKYGSFSRKTSKNTCVIMIRIIITFANQIFL